MILIPVHASPSGFKINKIISFFHKKICILNKSSGLHISLLIEKKEQTLKRTTHRSGSGKKPYAVRDSKGRFMDIHTYERARGADLKKKSKAEKSNAAKKKK